MIEWNPKDPDAVLDYAVDWAPFLSLGPVGDTIFDFSLQVLSGTVTFTDASAADGATKVRAVWHGGTDGEIAVILNRITTASGLIQEETITLPIISTTSIPTSGYTDPTPAQFIDRFPRFAAVSPTAIASALKEAEGMVDTSWTEADFAGGRMLWAAHVLTLDGLGGGAEAEAAAAGAGGFKVMKSGALTLERFEGAAGSGAAATGYGKRWLEMARRNKGGPVIAIAPQPPYNALAFDGDPWPY